MNLHIRQSLNRSNGVFTLANVNVFVVGDDISNGQKRIVADDHSIGWKLTGLSPPSDL